MEESVFVTGTDTGIGKTYVAVRIIQEMARRGLEVGVMKPYSAGEPMGQGALSEDAHALAEAAGRKPDSAINPDHQSMAAPPYARCLLGEEAPDPRDVIRRYRALAAGCDAMVVEGMGGCMVPILSDYYMADLARDMGLPAVIVSDNRVGAINQCIMSVRSCKERGVAVRGVILNMMHAQGGYGQDVLRGCITKTVGAAVIGTVQNGILSLNQSVAVPK